MSSPSRRKGASRAATGREPEAINPRSCVVIGAGLSGLSAAYFLTQQVEEPWDVTVLEAEKWAGGRVYSFNFEEAPELVCELGGEWIGDDHKKAINLCKKLGLELIPHRFDFFFYEKGRRGKQYRAGAWPFPASAWKQFIRLKQETRHWGEDRKKILDKKDWWTVLRDLGFDEHDLLRRDLMDSTDFGETIRMSGGFSAAAEYFESNPTDEMDWKIKGGNTELVRALEKAIWRQNGRILTGQHVAAIEQLGSPPRVIVRTKRGETFRARYCICTVPARTLTKIRFLPEFPDDQWDAAKQLQYARIMKTAMLCETRFWMKNKKTRFSCFTDETSDFVFDATLGQPGEKGILCSYSIGDKADDLNGYTEETLKAKLQADLKNIFPGAPVRILAIKKQAWQHNPLTQGAYAFYRPGQWFPVRDILARPFKNILFAGEHIADEQGFMDGAIDTGQDAARNLIRRVKRPRSDRK
jgi:monoamine oxidase